MRKMLQTTVMVVLPSVTLVCAQPQSFVEEHGQLAVKGTQLVDARGEPVVLRGMSFGWHVWWPQFWNGDAVKWLKEDCRCTVLRAAMGVEPQGGYLSQPESSKALVKTVVG